MPLSAGTRVGPYEIVAALGAGGMGEVYRARDGRLGRDVAVKVLPPDVAGDPERLARFEDEARAAAALNHANILSIYDVGKENGVAFMVSELVDGQTLRFLFARRPQTGETPLTVVTNWLELVSGKVNLRTDTSSVLLVLSVLMVL